MPTPLIAQLRQECFDDFERATDHPFVRELCDGTLDDSVLFTYLVQDLKFLTISLKLLARCMSLCDNDKSLLVIGQQIGYLSSTTATNFDEVITELRAHPEKLPPSMLKEPSLTLPEVQDFLDFLEEGMSSNSYTQLVTTVYVFEFIYLHWSKRHGSNEVKTRSLAYKHSVWISIHLNDAFENWVAFLGSEVARVTAGRPTEKEKAEKVAKRVVSLEGQFFDACYNYRQN